jgi:hypothetical protein
MNTRKYLPVWTDGLTYDEQHLTYWIANNMERVDQRYSFLPIRILGDFFCERKRFDNYIHFIRDFFKEEICRAKSRVVPLAYYVAEKSFDLAANEFFCKYPASVEVTFNKLNYNGVYDIEFAIGYETRLKLFQEILDRKIGELCVQDEVFEFHEIVQERHIPEIRYVINSRLDIKEEDIYYGFPQFLSSHKSPYKPKTQVKIKKEDIYSYFRFVPERIFNLGNQYIKHEQNSKELAEFFDAAKNRNLNVIKNYIDRGIDINSIDKYGATAFINYCGSPYEEKECCDIEDLKKLVELGANPAIYGAGTDEDPLSSACLDRNIEIVSFLLENGVNPHLFPCKDEPYEHMSETLLERTERWAVGDPNIDGIPDKTQQIILEMLKEYV